MRTLRNEFRWWLHHVADLVFERAICKPEPSRVGKAWCWLAIRLDRVAMWVGGPVL